MARKGEVDASSYQAARNDFMKLFPAYMPGRGISLYLEHR
jgi:hypothetical protein